MAWAPAYATEDELASYLRIDDTEDDVELGLANEAASRAIDQATNRQFGQSTGAEIRTYPARYDHDRGLWVVDIDDVQTEVGLGVEVDGTVVATYRLEPRNAAVKGRPWTRIVFTSDSEAQPTSCSDVDVTANPWGWTSVPGTIHNAQLLQASRFFTRRNAPFGVAGSPDAGSEMRLLAKVDPDDEVMVRAYRRPRAMG